MSTEKWRSESDAVLRSPTKRQLQQARASTVHAGCFKRRAYSNTFKAGLIGGIALVVIVVVLVPVLVTQMSVHGTKHQGPLDAAYCQRLSERAKQLCVGYQAAQGASKFIVATNWRQSSPASYYCAGIEADCLNADLQSNTAGSVCRNLADGTRCGLQQEVCKSGYCGGPQAETPTADKASFNAPAAPTVAGNITKSATTADEADSLADAAAEILLYRTPAVPAAANASWPTAIASVWPDDVGIRVPDAFLATSHEWKRMEDYAGVNIKAWTNIFSMLSASPVLRIGGASQDAMTEAPGPEFWEAVVRLQKATKCRYLIGLPLWQKNAVVLSQQIIEDAQKYLGDALIGFELGNEPEFWPTGLGGYDTNGKWVAGFEAFAAYFHRVAMALSPCTPGKSTNKPLLSGPGWGNVNTQDPSWFAKIVEQGANCYFWESNTHYYPYINNETVTNQELLSQWLQDFALDKFKAYAATSEEAGLNIRISETNSMYGGGRKDLSETMAGTLWTADALFAFADAGARAFHLHWGKGGEPNGDAPPSVGVQTNFDFKVPEGHPPLPWPSVHAPWFGYLMWTVAAAGGYGKTIDTSFVTANIDKWGSCTANIKVWAFKSDGGQVRITLLNKDLDKSCNIDIRLDSKLCSSTATLSRLLPGKQGMESKAGITWQGQHYYGAGTTGVIQGKAETELVKPTAIAETSCSYTVAMPKTSAAVFIVAPETPAV